MGALFLFSEEPHQQREDRADEQTGDNRKMEACVSFADIDVARQLPEPASAKAGPYQQSGGRDQQTDNEQQFSDFLHTWIIHSRRNYWSTVRCFANARLRNEPP